jgi:hypothetical protein
MEYHLLGCYAVWSDLAMLAVFFFYLGFVPEDGGRAFPQNISKLPPNYYYVLFIIMALQPFVGHWSLLSVS